MSDETRFDAVHVDANPAATVGEAPAAQIELLDQDEIVELSVKPSLWFVAIVSARVVVLVGAAGAIVTFALRDSGSQAATYVVPLAVLLALLRLVIASLQWASRAYILTNRRVMRLSGVLNVDIAECRLVRIGRINLRLATVQRLLRLGSVCMAPAGDGEPMIVWDHVAKAGEIHAKLIRAIKKAQSKR